MCAHRHHSGTYLYSSEYPEPEFKAVIILYRPICSDMDEN